MADDGLPRRDFLKGAGAAGTAVAALANVRPAEAQPAAPAPAPAPPDPAEAETFLTLNATEVAFLTAAVDAMIPADELSPSGSACGCVVFIDRQLASAWGGGAKMYRRGPFRKGTPEQGYQLPLSPREYLAAGIVAANAWARKNYGKDFDHLAAADRVTALKAMEEGKAEFANFDAPGLSSSGCWPSPWRASSPIPLYGGNRDKVSWKMLGFPGLPATYADKIEEYQTSAMSAEPQSIADFS